MRRLHRLHGLNFTELGALVRSVDTGRAAPGERTNTQEVLKEAKLSLRRISLAGASTGDRALGRLSASLSSMPHPLAELATRIDAVAQHKSPAALLSAASLSFAVCTVKAACAPKGRPSALANKAPGETSGRYPKITALIAALSSSGPGRAAHIEGAPEAALSDLRVLELLPAALDDAAISAVVEARMPADHPRLSAAIDASWSKRPAGNLRRLRLLQARAPDLAHARACAVLQAKSRPTELAAQACRALADDPEALSLLLKTAARGNVEMRRAAYGALAQRPEPEALAPIAALLPKLGEDPKEAHSQAWLLVSEATLCPLQDDLLAPLEDRFEAALADEDSLAWMRAWTHKLPAEFDPATYCRITELRELFMRQAPTERRLQLLVRAYERAGLQPAENLAELATRLAQREAASTAPSQQLTKLLSLRWRRANAKDLASEAALLCGAAAHTAPKRLFAALQDTAHEDPGCAAAILEHAYRAHWPESKEPPLLCKSPWLAAGRASQDDAAAHPLNPSRAFLPLPLPLPDARRARWDRAWVGYAKREARAELLAALLEPGDEEAARLLRAQLGSAPLWQLPWLVFGIKRALGEAWVQDGFRALARLREHGAVWWALVPLLSLFESQERSALEAYREHHPPTGRPDAQVGPRELEAAAIGSWEAPLSAWDGRHNPYKLLVFAHSPGQEARSAPWTEREFSEPGEAQPGLYLEGEHRLCQSWFGLDASKLAGGLKLGDMLRREDDGFYRMSPSEAHDLYLSRRLMELGASLPAQLPAETEACPGSRQFLPPGPGP